MKRIAIIFLLICGVLLTGCSDADNSTNTTVPTTTIQAQEPTPIWKKVEFLDQFNKWVAADSMEALSDMLSDYMTSNIGMGSDRLSITFRMNGHIEVTEPFEEAFASANHKEIGAWNSDRDPYVHTQVTLRYEDVNPETIWSLAQDDDILLVQFRALNVGWVEDE